MYDVDESDESEIIGYSRSAGLASRLLLELLQLQDDMSEMMTRLSVTP